MTSGSTSDTASEPSTPPSDRIAEAAGLAGTATLTSRILGLVREQVLAALFGASDTMDAFYVAFRIPNLLRDLFAEGAMSAAFVPTFTRHLTLQGREDAWRLANNVLNALLLITGLIVVAGLVFAGPLVTLYSDGFASVPGKLELTIRLARVMMPFLMLVAVAAAVMGMLNSLRHYFVPALAPATFNVVAILFAVGVTPLMPMLGQPAIMSMALAAVVGGLTQVAVQWPLLRREGFRYRPVLDLRDPGLRQVLVLMGPGTLGLAATQLNLFVSTFLAARQGTGAVSWLQYAYRIMYLPLGLFGVSIATAVLPVAARHAAVDDRAAIRRTLAHGLSLMLMVNVPATCGLVLLAPGIVRLLFERGHFTPADTVATATALQCYAAGLVGISTSRILSPVFYALRRSRVPVTLSAVSVAVNVGLSLLLVRGLGFAGLALATSCAALVNAGLCVLVLRSHLDGLGGRPLAVTTLKVLVAAAVMSAVVAAVNHVAAPVGHAGLARQAASLGLVILSGVGALALAARALGIEAFDDVWTRVAGKLRPSPAR